MNAAIKYVGLCLLTAACGTQKPAMNTFADYHEQHRPQVHFSPKEHWMNDPNGMVFHDGTYHLFYQYFPGASVWGPMHWGHATSPDMVNWTNQPVALYPDSLGYIFSGSAVVDTKNTSGFGKDGKLALVAIFTHHDPVREKQNRNDVETQSIAYSNDNGKTWTKYAGNPVLPNPGIRDFRDPKVSWFEEGNKWIMTLATTDRITFYSSPDLKSWTRESEFGKEFGAHGGVWECPDLFPINYNGKKIWVLIVNLNPGGPNGGSATQYFTGDFDGKTFTPFATDTRWIDYGPDEYAGITWSNTGDRRIFLGWMSNWQYANIVPTTKWRSANTIPRDLGIEKVGEKFLVTSKPVAELNGIAGKSINASNVNAANLDLASTTGKLKGPAMLKLSSDNLQSFSLTLSNAAGEKVVIGYDKASNQYFLDRTASGDVSFEKGFAGRHTAPRFSAAAGFDMTLIIDNSSVELFADNGLSTMTQIFFPSNPYTDMKLNSENMTLKSLEFTPLMSIWKN